MPFDPTRAVVVDPKAVEPGKDIPVEINLKDVLRGITVEGKQPVTKGFNFVNAVSEDDMLPQLSLPEERKKWEKMAPIGMAESWDRVEKTKFPGLTVFNIIKTGRPKAAEIPSGFIPFNPDLVFKSVDLISTTKRLIKNEDRVKEIRARGAKTREEGKLLDQWRNDEGKMRAFLLKSEEERVRGHSIMGNATRILIHMPSYMLEFLATSGIAAVGKKAVTTTLAKTLGQVAKKRAVDFAIKSTGFVSGAISRSVFQPHRVAQNYAQRRVSNQFEFTNEGIEILKESKEKPFTSAWKSFGDIVIENLSEESGQVIGKIGKKAITKIIPKKMSNALLKVLKKFKPGENINKYLTKAGYNGIIEEIGEERLGDMLRAVTGVEDYGTDNVFDRIILSIPDGEQIVAEAIAFSVPGVTGFVASQINIKGQEAAVEKELMKQGFSKTEAQGFVKELATMQENQKSKEAGVVPPSETINSIKGIPELRKVSPAQMEEMIAEAERQGIIVTPAELEEAIKRAPEVTPEAVIKALEPVPPKPEIKKAPITVLRETIEEARAEFKTEPAKTKAEIRAVQTDIIKQLEASDLVAKDKAKFIRAIKNIQTQEQAVKRLPEIQERIANLETKAQVRQIKSEIKKTLKATKPRIVAGKPVGKFTPEVQKVLDTLRNTLKLNQESASQKLISNLEKEGMPTPVTVLENKMLSLASGQQPLSPEELRDLSGDISALKEGGAAIAKTELMKKITQRRIEREESLESIVGRKTPSTSRVEGVFDKISRSLKSLGQSRLGWDNIMNMLAIDDKVAVGESKLEKATNVNKVTNEEKRVARIAIEDVAKRAMNSFDFTKEKQLVNKFRVDSKIESLGIFINARGEEVNFELSKAEARKLWMELQDPSLSETFFSENGNAYTEEMTRAVGEFLTQEDRNFALSQLDFYRNFYEKVNKVYAKTYGVNLPFNEFYSPISREHKDPSVVDEFLNDINFRRSVSTGSLKSRIANVKPIKIQSDIAVLQSHIFEMSHFIAWADKISQLNNIFADNEIKEMINRKFSSETRKTITGFIQDFTRGGIDRSKNFRTWDKLRVNFTRSVLAFKPAMFAKQMVSFIAYADTIPTASFVAGVADFISNPIKKTRILNETEFMKARGQNMTRDIKDAMKSEQWSAFKKSPGFLNSLMFMTKLGDRGAILVGGWSVYRHTLKKTGSKEKALAEFERVSSETQQSADLSQLSAWQRGTTFQKMFTMFTSSQNQYFRKEYMAIRNLIAGKITPTKAAKTILIYHFLLPMFFQWVSDFGKWNRKEQLRAALLGSFNGVFIIGDILDNIIRQLVGLRGFKFTTPIIDEINQIQRSFGKLAAGDLSNEDFFEALKELEETAGLVGGLPLKQVNNWLEGIKDILEGEPLIGALKLLGWSPYIVEANLEEGVRKR
jgi:hypothetical protein